MNLAPWAGADTALQTEYWPAGRFLLGCCEFGSLLIGLGKEERKKEKKPSCLLIYLQTVAQSKSIQTFSNHLDCLLSRQNIFSPLYFEQLPRTDGLSLHDSMCGAVEQD